jgi:hypothetical protein
MANTVAAPDVTTAAVRVAASPISLTPTVYYYRTGAGARSSTTDPSAIPAGAVLERSS